MEKNQNIKPEAEHAEDVEKKYPHIKRMLMTLDRFLEKRVAIIGAVYLLAILAGGVLLFANGVSAVNASSAGTYTTDSPIVSNTLVFSLLGVVSFIFALIAFRVVAVRMKTKKLVEKVEK